MSLQSFSPKDPEEVITLSVNFTNLLASGETVSACVFTAERQDGAAEDTAAMISGGADTTAAPIMRQKIAAGTNGVTYLIRAKVTTNAGRTIVGAGVLPVKRGAA